MWPRQVPEKSLPKPIRDMPEALVSDTRTSRAVSKAVAARQLRKLAPKLYTRNLVEDAQTIVRRNLWTIVGGYFPGALIADRTALENRPASDSSICLVSQGKQQDVRLPGLVLRPRKGHGPLESDRPYVGSLYLSSVARAYLENMRPTRSRKGLVRRTLPRSEIEERLDTLIRRSGEQEARKLRDEARAIAAALGSKEEFAELDALIGTLLGTREAELSAPAAVARSHGRPYDPDRLALFDELHRALRAYPPVSRPTPKRRTEGRATLAFFESYFSNFIEGTEFGVEEAADIVFKGSIPRERPKDAHDILGTWRIVSDPGEMSKTPTDSASLIRLLQSRHAAMLSERPEVNPGRFKTKSNRFGTTLFVEPELVVGTLEQGLQFCKSLEAPFQRAVYMMFLVSEVHPFTDGNGRIARIVMNAELAAAGEERIIIPTVYRSNYLAALRALSQNRITEPLIRTLDFAQRWTAAVTWSSLEPTTRELEACNAFLQPDVAEQEAKRLLLPSTALTNGR